MTSWLERHRESLAADLDDDEELLAAHRVEIRGNTTDAIEGERVRTRGSPRRRYIAARDNGFALPGPFFILGVSSQRVLFWRSSPMLAAPVELTHSVPLADVARVVLVRRLGRPHLAVLLGSGALLIVRSLWGGGLRDLETAFDTAQGTGP